jgi:hypothetical protein
MRNNLKEYIKKEDLVEGQLYETHGRNLGIGMWKKLDNGWKEYGFVYLRTKFGQQFLDVEYHWDEGAPFGTVKPVAKFNGTVEWLEEAKDFTR